MKHSTFALPQPDSTFEEAGPLSGAESFLMGGLLGTFSWAVILTALYALTS